VLITAANRGWPELAAPARVNPAARPDFALEGFVFGRAAPPAKFSTTLSADDSLGDMKVAGELSPSIDSPAARVAIDARGIRAGALAPYFPPGAALSTDDGRFKASIEASVSPHPEGGRSAKLVVQGID
jgi:hypothetical protein